MTCPHCGEEMLTEQVFCGKCGKERLLVPVYEPDIEASVEETMNNILDDIGIESPDKKKKSSGFMKKKSGEIDKNKQ